MQQSQDFQPIQGLKQCPSCLDCPMFTDFQCDPQADLAEPARSRGWCSAFEKISKTFHPRTNTCELAIKQHQQENPIEVQVTLCSHELGVDPDDGHIFAKEQRVISLVVPEITRKAVMKAFEQHQHQFQGFYVLDFNRCYGRDAEF